jgi:hypothetical protein
MLPSIRKSPPQRRHPVEKRDLAVISMTLKIPFLVMTAGFRLPSE